MNITVDISMYPLAQDYKPAIKKFIRELRTHDDVEIVTNQMSTQLRGEMDIVTTALNDCMRNTLRGGTKVVFVARYINADLDIGQLPDID
jgi:uncharacterized protein YqgV (UPF0045/DUF77 family)